MTRDATTSIPRAPSPSKIGWIVGIALATVVPTFLVSQVIGDRESRAADARADIARSWGPSQTVNGPVLGLPIDSGNATAR